MDVLPVPAPATKARSRPEANTSRATCCSFVGSMAMNSSLGSAASCTAAPETSPLLTNRQYSHTFGNRFWPVTGSARPATPTLRVQVSPARWRHAAGAGAGQLLWVSGALSVPDPMLPRMKEPSGALAGNPERDHMRVRDGDVYPLGQVDQAPMPPQGLGMAPLRRSSRPPWWRAPATSRRRNGLSARKPASGHTPSTPPAGQRNWLHAKNRAAGVHGLGPCACRRGRPTDGPDVAGGSAARTRPGIRPPPALLPQV